MRDVTISLEALTPYSSSRYFEQDLQKGETIDAHERRRWREKLHTNDAGDVFIPGISFKLALDETAKLLNEKIKGKGNQTYTAIFQTGVVATSDVEIGVNKDAVKPIEIYANADGVRGSGKRVMRLFPIIPTWRGELQMRIFNDALPEDVFERFFTQAGVLAGVGRGRPRTGCPAGNGRFKPIRFEWAAS